MEPSHSFRPLAVLTLGALLLSFAPQDSTPPAAPEADQGLRRLEPVQVRPPRNEDDPLLRAFSREFDRARWSARLATTDLDVREEAYDDLLRRARIDPVARAFVDELARDTARPELAWTARLALRELGRPTFPGLTLLPESSHAFGTRNRQFEALLEEMAAEVPGLNGLLLPEAWRPGEGGSTFGVQVQETPDGARVIVTERGERREYSGTSLEAILEANPELREKMFVAAERSRPIRTDKLGVRVVPVSAARAAELGLEPGRGLTVLSTYPGTIASHLGVRAGDVLLEMNGEPLSHPDEITARIQGAPRGTAAGKRRVTLVWVDDLGQRHRRNWP